VNVTEKLIETLGNLQRALELQHAELRAALTQTTRSNRLRGARPAPAPGASGGRALLSSGAGRLVGWSLTATGGPVHVTLTDAREAGAGEPVAVIDVPEGGAGAALWLGPGGVSFGDALRVDVAGTGALQGVFWLGAVD